MCDVAVGQTRMDQRARARRRPESIMSSSVTPRVRCGGSPRLVQPVTYAGLCFRLRARCSSCEHDGTATVDGHIAVKEAERLCDHS